MSLFSPLVLPNGATIPNRIAKAAMEENMADDDHAPSAELIPLYQNWADGGAGLIITGNVMVDARAMTGPAGVVLEDDRYLNRFKAWADTARSRVRVRRAQTSFSRIACAVSEAGFRDFFHPVLSDRYGVVSGPDAAEQRRSAFGRRSKFRLWRVFGAASQLSTVRRGHTRHYGKGELHEVAVKRDGCGAGSVRIAQ